MRTDQFPEFVIHTCEHCDVEQEAKVQAIEVDSVYVVCPYCKEHAYIQVIF